MDREGLPGGDCQAGAHSNARHCRDSPATLEHAFPPGRRPVIEYRGDVTQYNVAPLTVAVFKGLLSPVMESAVNYVNAPMMAKERGITNYRIERRRSRRLHQLDHRQGKKRQGKP